MQKVSQDLLQAAVESGVVASRAQCVGVILRVVVSIFQHEKPCRNLVWLCQFEEASRANMRNNCNSKIPIGYSGPF